MNEWKQAVGRNHGMSDATRKFIKEACMHIATYRALRDADKRFQDPKDTAEQLHNLREMLQETGRALMTADRQVESYAGQGWALRPLSGMPPDFAELGAALQNIGFAVDAILPDVAPDLEQRRGEHKHFARKTLVKSLYESYAECFGQPKTADPAFTEIMEYLLGDLGITSSNLPRLLRDSLPPTH